MKWQKVKFLWFRWQNTHLWSWSGRRHFWQGPSVQIVSKVTLQTSKTFLPEVETKDKLTSRCHVHFWKFFTGFALSVVGKLSLLGSFAMNRTELINWPCPSGWTRSGTYDFGKPGKILIIHCKVSWQSFTALVFFTFRIESNYTARSWSWNVGSSHRTCTDS